MSAFGHLSLKLPSRVNPNCKCHVCLLMFRSCDRIWPHPQYIFCSWHYVVFYDGELVDPRLTELKRKSLLTACSYLLSVFTRGCFPATQSEDMPYCSATEDATILHVAVNIYYHCFCFCSMWIHSPEN
jgi:hypothetical protein